MSTPVGTAQSLVKGASHLSRRIIFSYVIDWVVIIATAIIGGAFSKIQGNKHAFSLYDPNISYPHKPKDTISFGALIVVALAGPAFITAVISLVFVPGPTANKHTPKSLVWRRKLWEWNTAWMGLGVAVAGVFMFTEGLKDLAGKPRPDLLARCQPDLSPASLSRYQVGGLEKALSEAAIIVDWHICQNKDLSTLRDGFASWPSGHSSFSWAGMLYLSLWLCAKFAISIPFLAPGPYTRSTVYTFDDDTTPNSKTGSSSNAVPARNQAAAPPVYLLVIAFIPIGVAFFVCVSRWSDYRHHGFDIISGALLGAFFAWLGFRWYHLPIQTGAGWSWGARSKKRAFGIGVGIPSYVGDEGWESNKFASQGANDLENQIVMCGGIQDGRESDALGESESSNAHSKHPVMEET